MGTPAYMSPEQLLGKPVDARRTSTRPVAVLYELATARRPHAIDRASSCSMRSCTARWKPPSSVIASLSPGLDAVIVKLLDKDPELRYQTARELVVDLERLRESTPRTGLTSTRALDEVRTQHRRRRRGRRLAIGGTLVVALLAASAWLLRPPRRRRSARSGASRRASAPLSSEAAATGRRSSRTANGPTTSP